MFLDEAYVTFKSGTGGNGIVAFRREKYVPKGGPSGGSGGTGGNIIIKVDPGLRTLINFSKNKLFKAENGYNGENKNKHGKNGKDLIIGLPLGTIGYDLETNEKLFDLDSSNKIIKLLKGGRGGKGNKAFATSLNPAPHLCENGEPGIEKKIKLELNLLSDVGIVGKPSVGKSMLLSAISNATPKIADYEFTTLSPQLGVVSYKLRNFVAADLPGLIKGASLGKGLGYQFLRHIKRTKILWHILDITSLNIDTILNNYYEIENELKNYSMDLYNKERLIIVSKIDLVQENDMIHLVNLLEKKINNKIYKISSIRNEGLDEIKIKTLSILEELDQKEIKDDVDKETVIYNLDNYIFKNNNKKLKYEIEVKKDNIYVIISKELEKKYIMTNKNYYESRLKFTSFLYTIGVYDELIKKGANKDSKIYLGEEIIDLFD